MLLAWFFPFGIARPTVLVLRSPDGLVRFNGLCMCGDGFYDYDGFANNVCVAVVVL